MVMTEIMGLDNKVSGPDSRRTLYFKLQTLEFIMFVIIIQ